MVKAVETIMDSIIGCLMLTWIVLKQLMDGLNSNPTLVMVIHGNITLANGLNPIIPMEIILHNVVQ